MVDWVVELFYHPEVQKDLAGFDQRFSKRIKAAIENRLAVAPHRYGEPLRKTLKGYWKLRVGEYRVMFKIITQGVLILGIIRHKEVQERIEKRFG